MCVIPKIPFFISCLESRIESATSFYGCFSLGFFEKSQCLTIANALRRTLLTNIYGIAITSVKIEGVNHEYQSIPGTKESVLDIILNLKEIVLKNFNTDIQACMLKKPLYGYLQVRGPGIIQAKDLRLPSNIQCVNPTQYIATLSEDGILNMKLKIGSFFTEKMTIHRKNANSPILKAKNNFKLSEKNDSIDDVYSFNNVYSFVDQYSSQAKPIDLDVIFTPVSKVNYVLTQATHTQKKFYNHKILLEV